MFGRILGTIVGVALILLVLVYKGLPLLIFLKGVILFGVIMVAFLVLKAALSKD